MLRELFPASQAWRFTALMAPTRRNNVRAAKRRDGIKESRLALRTGISQIRERPLKVRDVKLLRDSRHPRREQRSSA
jgi:hypothetical protein